MQLLMKMSDSHERFSETSQSEETFQRAAQWEAIY